MAANSSSASQDLNVALIKEVKSHEVAIDELNCLPSSRAVYQKQGSLFFRTTTENAKDFEHKQLDQAKAKLEKLTSK